jgi:hypothetical protein
MQKDTQLRNTDKSFTQQVEVIMDRVQVRLGRRLLMLEGNMVLQEVITLVGEAV